MTCLRCDTRGINPVIATILMIALTVAAVGIVAAILQPTYEDEQKTGLWLMDESALSPIYDDVAWIRLPIQCHDVVGIVDGDNNDIGWTIYSSVYFELTDGTLMTLVETSPIDNETAVYVVYRINE